MIRSFARSKLIGIPMASATAAISKPTARRLTVNFRHFSTEQRSSSQTILSFSTASLGLEYTWIRPVLNEIRQLPEVEAVVEENSELPPDARIDHLQRAKDIFSKFQSGGREHVAVQSLLAEAQQRSRLYEDALHTLEHMRQQASDTDPLDALLQDDLCLAQAKVHWTFGNFSEAQLLCDSIISTYDDFDETFALVFGNRPVEFANLIFGHIIFDALLFRLGFIDADAGNFRVEEGEDALLLVGLQAEKEGHRRQNGARDGRTQKPAHRQTGRPTCCSHR